MTNPYKRLLCACFTLTLIFVSTFISKAKHNTTPILDCINNEVISIIPENNSCETATAINCWQSIEGSTVDASFAPPGIDFCNGVSSPSAPAVWYKNTAIGYGNYNLSIALDNFDTQLFVYTGTCGDLQCIGGSDGSPISWWAYAGQTFYIMVTGEGNQAGDFVLDFDCSVIDACDYPNLSTMMVDNEGNEIMDCLPPGSQYQVQVTLTGGSDNSFTVLVGDSSKVMSPPETHIFGSFDAGTNTNVLVSGDDFPAEFCDVYGLVESELCVPENDLCANAVQSTCNNTVTGTTVGATQDINQAYCGTIAPGSENGGVWYVFTLTGTTDVDLDLSGSEYDTKIFLYSGECGALACIDGDDDGGTGLASRIQTQLEGGTYYIYVTGYGSSRGEYELTFNCISAPCGPGVSAIATDAEGNPIGENCIDQTGEYWVVVSIGDGGQTVWYASVNGGEPVQILPNESGLLGPVSALEVANISVTGVENPSCPGFASVTVAVCPPSNDLPCDAIALPNDGSVSTYTNINATADEGEATPDAGNCQTAWCEGAVDNSVWFTFVAPESGSVDVTLCGENSTGFDSQLAVWAAENCADYGTYNLIGSNDDAECEISGLISSVEVCAEPGQTYYVQVDGWNGAMNPFDISISEVDGAICNCVLPDLGDGDFIFADTAPLCEDLENPQFSVTFYAPNDLGSQEGMLYTYDWAGNEGDPISIVVAGDPVTIPETFDPGTFIDVSVTITEEACEEAEGSIYPLFGVMTLGFVNCDACPVIGDPCEDEDGLPGFWNTECECVAYVVNDDPCNAIAVNCDDVIEGNTAGATPSGLNAFCAGGSDQDLFYTLDAVPGSDYTITVNGDDYDGVLSLLMGDCDGNLTEFACADNGITIGIEEVIEFSVDEPTTVLIRTYNWNPDTQVDFTLTIDCELTNETNFDGTVAWDVACGDRPISINFYNIGTADMVASYNSTVAPDGSFSIQGVQLGTFDVILTVEGYLAVGVEDVEVPFGGVALDFGELIGGDINGDNGINIIDFSALNAAFGSLNGDDSFNPYADINCDGGINIIDFSMLNVGFGMTGDTPGGE